MGFPCASLLFGSGQLCIRHSISTGKFLRKNFSADRKGRDVMASDNAESDSLPTENPGHWGSLDLSSITWLEILCQVICTFSKTVVIVGFIPGGVLFGLMVNLFMTNAFAKETFFCALD
jgi:hypothetical protein